MTEYWRIAEAEAPVLIDSPKRLEDAADIISKAIVVGLDCEWPPSETGHRPAATVLQLACLIEPSQELKLVVLVLDLLALDATATSTILQNLFRKEEILKIGYAFKSDVFALDNALNKSSGNGSPVALIENIIDISSLHRHLYQQLRCPNVHSCGEGGGLGGLVNANLGLPLDKSQQCSAWGSRPLTLEQLKYAATDAACLIPLFTYFLHCWEQREQESAEDNATEYNNDENSSLSSSNVVLKFTQTQLRSSVERWAERWELTGQGRKKVQKTGGLSQYDVEDESLSTAAKKKKKNRSAAAAIDFPTFPLQIPWMDEESIVSSPLFIADVMLQGLARQLRLWGFDAESVAVVSKTERHVVHRQLVERAEVEGRVILTRDAIFMRRNLSDQAYFVRSENKKEQLQEVVHSFKLPLLQTLLLSRCAHCNSEFGETPIPASELSTEEVGIPTGVLERVNEFWVCSGCKKVYWQGSMYERAMERLGEALQSMTVGGGSGKDDAAVEQQACLT